MYLALHSSSTHPCPAERAVCVCVYVYIYISIETHLTWSGKQSETGVYKTQIYTHLKQEGTRGSLNPFIYSPPLPRNALLPITRITGSEFR
ncbi:hypothetical protein FKM82_030609 [Ascaphus truei]